MLMRSQSSVDLGKEEKEEEFNMAQLILFTFIGFYIYTEYQKNSRHRNGNTR